MLMQCVDDLSLKDNVIPLSRLSFSGRKNPLVIKITDGYGNNIVYSYQRFIEIIDSMGLDGFAF